MRAVGSGSFQSALVKKCIEQMWENDCLRYATDSDMVVTENWPLCGLTALLRDAEGFLGYGLFFLQMAFSRSSYTSMLEQTMKVLLFPYSPFLCRHILLPLNLSRLALFPNC